MQTANIRGFGNVGRLALVLLATGLTGCSPAGGTSWYVDYQDGRDQADGRTPLTAWKHSPGDKAATGKAAATDLKPGDQVIFRAGVPYRGTVFVRWNGTAEQPITFTGLGWGDGLGEFDGGNPVLENKPCPSAAACGGAPNWADLHLVRFAAPLTPKLVLFGPSGVYYQSQYPKLSDPFFADSRAEYKRIARNQLPELQAGRLHEPTLAAMARSGGMVELLFWVRGNEVIRRPVLAVTGDVLQFDPQGLQFWTDRENAVSLIGSIAGLSGPGHYSPIAADRMLVWPRPEDKAAEAKGGFVIGDGRNAIVLGAHDHIEIKGLRFRNFVGAARHRRQGMPIAAWNRGGTGVRIAGNHFGPGFLENGQGVIQMAKTQGLHILSNRIENVQYASGLRGGGHVGLVMEGNVIRRVGRTAITLFSTEDSVVRGNVIADIRGIHANGITAYLGNRNLRIEGNCVVMSSRPLTYHGDKTPEIRNDILIQNNILVTSPDGQGGLISWGAGTNGVRIIGNQISGPRLGLMLHQSDRNVQVTGNELSDYTTRGPVPADWIIKDNIKGLGIEQALRGQFDETGCSIPGSRLGLKLVRAGL